MALATEVAGERDVSVCAANTPQQLLRAGLPNEIELSVVPLPVRVRHQLFDHLGPDLI